MDKPDKATKQRSSAQNRSLHKYCAEMATELQNSGITVEVFLKGMEAEFTPETVKMMWRAFGKAKYGKSSTAELTTSQVNEVYDECNRHVAQFGIHVAFPSQEAFIDYEANM
jgi:hypothetical protein